MSTRDKILELLEERRGEFVSGAELARSAGVSGTAVWKAVRKLQAEGFGIDAVTNKGYRLPADADILSAQLIQELMAGSTGEDGAHEAKAAGPVPARVEVFDSVGSTNSICRDRAMAGEPGGYVAAAAEQTAGRGRRGRSFYSPAGTGLYMSILLRPSGCTAERALRFTTIAAVAVAEAIEEISGKAAGIKWVNDILIDGKKVCGILTEASFDLETGTLDYAVVGIGINLYTPAGGFPKEIRDIAGAVFGENEAGGPDTRSRVAAAVLRNFFRYYEKDIAGNSAYADEYRHRCVATGREVNVLRAGAEPVRALALGVDDECRLLVRYPDGTEEALSSGEISIRL